MKLKRTARELKGNIINLSIDLYLKMKYGLKNAIANQAGQGTTEYAILVGVLAVIAMIAIAAFKDKIQTLWDSIQSGVEGL